MIIIIEISLDLIELLLSSLPECLIGNIDQIRTEVTYGINRNSRIDLLLTPNPNNNDTRQIFIEIKNTTWVNLY